MKNFVHVDVTSVEDAVAILSHYNGKAVLNAGGTDLLGVLKDRILPDYPEVVINIKTINNLAFIREDEEGLSIGALTKLREIINSENHLAKYPGLVQAARSIATPEIRNMGTLGGNLCQDVRCWYYRYPHRLGGRINCLLKRNGPCPAIKGDNRYHAIINTKACHAVCPSDMAVILSALDAQVILAGPEGERSVAVIDFYKPLRQDLKSNEILLKIVVPKPAETSRHNFVKFGLRKSIDFAIVSAAVAVTFTDGLCSNASIALGAVAPMPVRASNAEKSLVGKPLNDLTIQSAAELAVADARPMSMNSYKVDIARALVKRALQALSKASRAC